MYAFQTLSTIVKEFTEFITTKQVVVPLSDAQSDPHFCVGKNILHKFILESGGEMVSWCYFKLQLYD